MSQPLSSYVHYVVGTAALVVSLELLYEAIREKSFTRMDDTRLATAIIGLLLGVLIIIKQHNSIPLIAVAWGLSGLAGGVTELTHASYAIAHRERFALKLIHGLIETTLALILIFDPHEAIRDHIFILGLEMLVQAFAAQHEH